MLALVLPVTGLVSAGSEACATTAPAPVAGVHQVGSFYVDIRSVDASKGNDVWIYEETNNMAGLQRGGYSAIPVMDDRDLCRDRQDVPPDQLIY